MGLPTAFEWARALNLATGRDVWDLESPGELRLMLLYMAHKADTIGEVSVYAGTTAREAGVPKRRVRGALGRLEARGLIKPLEQSGPGVPHKSLLTLDH